MRPHPTNEPTQLAVSEEATPIEIADEDDDQEINNSVINNNNKLIIN